MLFNFIRYTQPGWQFNLTPKINGSFASCYITEQRCPKEYIDERYQTKTAQIADAGYRLWNQGVLLESTKEEVDPLHQSENISLIDEYIFIRKYWGTFWATFALLLRIFTFKNPFKEIYAYYATRKVNRINAYESALEYRDFETFQSPLIASKPLVAVIIPTLNRYNYLKDVLHDLEKQSYRNFEVIVVDQSDDFQSDFYNRFNLRLKIIRQTEKLLWTARNKAVKATGAEYLLFFDDDSRVEPDINGLKSISNPKAFRHHLKVSTGGLREMGSWDGFRSKKWFAPKPVPSVIYLFKKYFPPYLCRNALFIGILLSNIPYKYKGSSKMLLLSLFLTLLKAPVLVIQFYKSLLIAKKMLRQNPSLIKLKEREKCV